MGKSFNTAQRQDGMERKLHSVSGKTRGRIPLQSVALTDPDDFYEDSATYSEHMYSDLGDEYTHEGQ